jgi:hypothetical protein
MDSEAVNATILEPIAAAIRKFGRAQLVFDDFDRALDGPIGPLLERVLYEALVDAPGAGAIGAVFFLRVSSRMQAISRGSPIASRLETRFLPGWDEADLAGASWKAAPMATRELVGESGSMLARLTDSGFETLVEDMRPRSDAALRDLPADVRRVIQGDRTESMGSIAVRRVDWVLHHAEGQPHLTTIARRLGLGAQSLATSAQWPDTFPGSVRKFAELAAGAAAVIWVDRYLYSEVASLEQFLRGLRALTEVPVQLIGSRMAGRVHPPTVASMAASIPDIDARYMPQSRIKDLHDRHLVRSREQSGWLVPTSRVILGLDAPGSAVCAKADAFGLDYDLMWETCL